MCLAALAVLSGLVKQCRWTVQRVYRETKRKRELAVKIFLALYITKHEFRKDDLQLMWKKQVSYGGREVKTGAERGMEEVDLQRSNGPLITPEERQLSGWRQDC